jgi:glycosyltransferase involved in cell wall biosynthesis
MIPIARRCVKAASLVAARLRARMSSADVSMFHTFVAPPYGGGNQFMRALWNEVDRRGWRLENNTVSPTTRACLYNSFNFDFERLRALRRPHCRMVHRVDGPVSAYRGTDAAIDREIWALNHALSDATVFQSKYSLAKHDEMGLRFRHPVIISNAADPAIFHARGRAAFLSQPRVRLIASSWSDNVNKGADVYAWLDRHLDFSKYEFTFMGRSPVSFKNIRLLPPAGSEAVADELRRHDIFVIASRNEPCSNALIEAMSCGLPVAYLDSGSHGELVGEGGVPFAAAEQSADAIHLIAGSHDRFATRVRAPALADVADAYLAVMGLPARPVAQ